MSAERVCDGCRMLNVIMGVGVRVRVVNDERVIPFLSWSIDGAGFVIGSRFGSEWEDIVVRTTTEWGSMRIRWRRVVDSAGSGDCGFGEGEVVVEYSLSARAFRGRGLGLCGVARASNG